MTRTQRWSLAAFAISCLVSSAVTVIIASQLRTPLATEAEKALAPLLISTDGSTVTFRETAIDPLRICVEPKHDTFGKTICFTVGDVRRERWGLK